MLLRLGMRSGEVAHVQHALNLATRFTPKLKIDGIFGEKTDGRVRQFQSAKKLSSDGIVGPLSLNALFTGVRLEALIVVRPKSQANPSPLPPAPAPFVFNPFVIDPRDVAWHAQVQAWRIWVMKPFPKEPAPPLPATAPPSLSLPPTGLSVPPLPKQPVSIPQVPPGGTVRLPVPFLTGANFETAVAAGFSDKESPGKFKLKLQEFKLKIDFAKVTGLSDSETVKAETELNTNDKGNLEIEQSVSISPFKIFSSEGTLADFKAAPLIVSALSSSFDVSQFAGVKAMATFRPFGRGFEIEVGGKLGPKFKLSHDENSAATTSAYPLVGEGTVGMTFKF
jgi:peptidoglycan hydrolase-like protein with peptidoglycan-binding domain